MNGSNRKDHVLVAFVKRSRVWPATQTTTPISSEVLQELAVKGNVSAKKTSSSLVERYPGGSWSGAET